MSDSIGQQLAARREVLGLTIEDVAHKTRIHADVLRHLEADELAQLPNEMFAKSFLKIYSEHIGVDAGNVIAQLSVSEAQSHGSGQYLLGGLKASVREKFGHLSLSIPYRPILGAVAAIALLAVGGTYLVTQLNADNSVGDSGDSELAGGVLPDGGEPILKEDELPVEEPETEPELFIQEPDPLASEETTPVVPKAKKSSTASIDKIDIDKVQKALPVRTPSGNEYGGGDEEPEPSLATENEESEGGESLDEAVIPAVDESPEEEEEFLDPGIVPED